ncbi:MAG: hypothetical protein ACI4EN_04195 [Butyrivibrio sp.]
MSGYYKDEHRYDDIINLPHHQSKARPHMSLHDRAAQFAPFAALSGHEEAIEETARLTDDKILLDDTATEKINEKLYEISQHLSEKRNVSITYFRPDAHKSGGAYLTDMGTIKRIDEIEKVIIMDSGIKIPMEHITGIEMM